MSKYAKFNAQAQAEAQDRVAQEAKRRLEQLESERTQKKARLEQPFYEDEEEEEDGGLRDGQYEAYYALWNNLEERHVAREQQQLEQEWAALKKRITALGVQSAPVPHSIAPLAELEREHAAFDERVAVLRPLRTALEGRDYDAECRALQTRKQACFVRFKALSESSDLLRGLRDTLRQAQTRSLSEPQMRALTAPLNLTALFACALSDAQSVYYGESGGYVALLAGERFFLMVRRDTLLL